MGDVMNLEETINKLAEQHDEGSGIEIDGVWCYGLVRPGDKEPELLCISSVIYGSDCDIGNYTHGYDQPVFTMNLSYMSERIDVQYMTVEAMRGDEYQFAGRYGYTPTSLNPSFAGKVEGTAWETHDDDPCEPRSELRALTWMPFSQLDQRFTEDLIKTFDGDVQTNVEEATA